MTSHPNNASSDERPASPSPIKVVIVEDDATVRQLLREWVEQSPALVCRADLADAEAALAALPRIKPDVALVDINLPGISGIDCVRRLKLQLPDTQFVMLTVYEDPDHILTALKAGATGYLLKRTPRDQLLRAIEEVHAGSSPMTGNIARKIVQSFQFYAPEAQESEKLSPQESRVLDLLARGYLYKEVADQMQIGIPTVKTYIRRVCEKLHVHTRAEAVAVYAKLPWRNQR
jgi:DNA-binding NarL/FixJ family response regulator